MNPKRTWLSALVAGALVLTACGGDDDSPNDDAADETTTPEASPTDAEGNDAAPATAPVEALRVPFESVHDGPFRLFDLEGDLWLVESDFGAFRVDLSVPVSGCEITTCLSSPSVRFRDTFIPVGARLFTVNAGLSPNQFVWIGSEVADGPHNVLDHNSAPGNASGDFSEVIARVDDRLYVHDSTSGAIESIDATVASIDTEPVIGTPISTLETLDPTSDIVTPFPDNTRVVSDGETLWVYSTSQRPLYPSGETGPPPAAVVDIETDTLGPIFGLTPSDEMVDYDNVGQVTAAAGYLVVERSLVDRDSTGEDSSDFAQVITAFAPDGTATDFDTPIAQLRNLVASGDLVFAVAQPEDGSQTYILDPADGSATPIDLGVDGDATVTANYGDDEGVWAVIETVRGVPDLLLRVDLETETVVERIDLTEDLEEGLGPRFVRGRPYFVLGDGESDEWELVILGGDGIDLGYPAPPATEDQDEDQADDDGEPRDEELLADPDYQDGFERGRFNAENWGPEYRDPESFDPDASPEFKAGYADGFASYEGEAGGGADQPPTDDTVAEDPAADDECEPGESLEECYG